MGKIVFFLALLGFLFFYYSKPVSVGPQKTVQQEVKKETSKFVGKKVKSEPKPKEEQIIEVEEVMESRPLPELSSIIIKKSNHPYADPDKYPLHYAICKGDLNLVKNVLRRESLINEPGEVVRGIKECYCPENKYEICSCEATLTMPPLNLAVFKKDEEIIKYLLRKKANPLLKDELGRNALDIAQQQRMAEIQNLLAKYIK